MNYADLNRDPRIKDTDIWNEKTSSTWYKLNCFRGILLFRLSECNLAGFQLSVWCLNIQDSFFLDDLARKCDLTLWGQGTKDATLQFNVLLLMNSSLEFRSKRLKVHTLLIYLVYSGHFGKKKNIVLIVSTLICDFWIWTLNIIVLLPVRVILFKAKWKIKHAVII